VRLLIYEFCLGRGSQYPVAFFGDKAAPCPEEVHDKCLQRLTARIRFNEGWPGELADQLVQQFCDEHPERYLLAFVYRYLGDHDLLCARTEAEKYLQLASLNLVECVAFVGS
jgi:hypothetical protein